MKAQTNKDIALSIGTSAPFYTQINDGLKFVSGIYEIEYALRAKDLISFPPCAIRKARRGLRIIAAAGFTKTYSIAISFDSISSIYYKDLGSSPVDVMKVGASAVLGGIIAGELGAFVGAMNSLANSKGTLLLIIEHSASGKKEAVSIAVPVIWKKKTDMFIQKFAPLHFDRIPVNEIKPVL